jgi:flagellar biosynthetic protein FliR
MGGLDSQLLAVFLLFCRIGGCLLFGPGFSSPRIPVHIRLFGALALTAAISPILTAEIVEAMRATPENQFILLIIRETVIGAAIGLMARFFILALQFSATAISNFIGLAGIPGIPLEEGDTGSPLATLVSSAAIALLFILGLHIELIKAVVDSYQVLQPGASLPIGALTSSMMTVLSETWLLALRLAAPFLLYAVTVNFALGLGNRFAQQVSMYHATTGAVILGGFLLLYLIWMDWILVFLGVYESWLTSGGF